MTRSVRCAMLRICLNSLALEGLTKKLACFDIIFKISKNTFMIVFDLVSSKKLEDLKFPDMNIQDGMEPTMKSIAIHNYLMDLNGYSETAASYMCCKISEASYSDFEELSMKYEKWCDVNFAHFEKTQEILDLAKQYYQKMDYFHTVSTFCPRRITTKHKVKLTDNQSKIFYLFFFFFCE